VLESFLGGAPGLKSNEINIINLFLTSGTTKVCEGLRIISENFVAQKVHISNRYCDT